MVKMKMKISISDKENKDKNDKNKNMLILGEYSTVFYQISGKMEERIYKISKKYQVLMR